MPNPKSGAWYSGGGLYADLKAGTGNVFYVYGIDGGIGSNANDGLTPQTPFLTLTYALTQCVAGNQDYIVILDYWQPTGEVWPISVDVNAVHIIGAYGAGAKWSDLTPPGATAAISIAANNIELAQLVLTAGATDACVQSAAGGDRWGTLIRDCWMGVTGGAQDGFRSTAGGGDNPYLKIIRCRFGHLLTRDGVRIEQNATRCMIGTPWGNGNLFDGVQGIAIDFVTNGAQVGIYNNMIAIPANTAGAGITLGAAATDAIVFGNQANFGDTSMGNNPFSDAAGAGANNWGLNYQGIVAVMPT